LPANACGKKTTRPCRIEMEANRRCGGARHVAGIRGSFMSILERFLSQVFARVQRRRKTQEFARELQADLELEAEEQQDSGVSAEEARYAALRAFGNTSLITE